MSAAEDAAADVAEDYRQALEDLTVNSRIEIATLTNIARENSQHAMAIAEVLANHIKKVRHLYMHHGHNATRHIH